MFIPSISSRLAAMPTTTFARNCRGLAARLARAAKPRPGCSMACATLARKISKTTPCTVAMAARATSTVFQKSVDTSGKSRALFHTRRSVRPIPTRCQRRTDWTLRRPNEREDDLGLASPPPFMIRILAVAAVASSAWGASEFDARSPPVRGRQRIIHHRSHLHATERRAGIDLL